MNRYPNKLFCLLILCAITSTSKSADDIPPPATNLTFTLPLADTTDAQAIVLRAPELRYHLIYATSTGEMAVWTLTPSNVPIPPDPIPPVPPLPDKLHIAIVENPLTTTQAQRQVLAAPAWRAHAKKDHHFLGVIPHNLKDKRTGQPPAHLQPFLDRAALHNLPWIIFANDAGTIIWEGPLPPSAKELENLIPQPREPPRANSDHN